MVAILCWCSLICQNSKHAYKACLGTLGLEYQTRSWETQVRIPHSPLKLTGWPGAYSSRVAQPNLFICLFITFNLHSVPPTSRPRADSKQNKNKIWTIIKFKQLKLPLSTHVLSWPCYKNLGFQPSALHMCFLSVWVHILALAHPTREMNSGCHHCFLGICLGLGDSVSPSGSCAILPITPFP